MATEQINDCGSAGVTVRLCLGYGLYCDHPAATAPVIHDHPPQAV